MQVRVQGLHGSDHLRVARTTSKARTPASAAQRGRGPSPETVALAGSRRSLFLAAITVVSRNLWTLLDVPFGESVDEPHPSKNFSWSGGLSAMGCL
jgi:hypothetical protein